MRRKRPHTSRCVESLQALPTLQQAASDVSGLDAERAIDALGRDIFAFLAASVLVVRHQD